MKKLVVTAISTIIAASGCSIHGNDQGSTTNASSADQLVECYGVGNTDAPVLMAKKFCDVLPSTQQVVVTPKDYVQCYGVAAAGKNDCATATVSCGGKVKTDRDPGAWVSLPKGICENLKGGVIKSANNK